MTAYKKALALDDALGHKEGMTHSYTGLGHVCLFRGELDRAEAMYRKSLALNEGLGNKEGMATAYTNLGTVYRTRGDFGESDAMFQKALDFFRHGRPQRAACIAVSQQSHYRRPELT